MLVHFKNLHICLSSCQKLYDKIAGLVLSQHGWTIHLTLDPENNYTPKKTFDGL